MPSAAAAIEMQDVLAATQHAFALVEVHAEAEAVQEAWAELERIAPCSIYQTRRWVLPWLATLGQRTGITPFFILARGADRRPAALLTLGIIKRGPLRVAVWLGDHDSNFNLALLRTPSAWTKAEITRLLGEAAKACGRERPDLFSLMNQPLTWGAAANPFAQLTCASSPSAAYGTRLPPDAETLFAEKLSKDTRKKLRKKEARLAQLGALSHIVVETAGEQRRVVDLFIAQKTERFRAQGIVSNFDTPEMRAFVDSASPPNGTGIELHALQAGDRIVAIYGGAANDGQWSGMFNSFDADEEISKSSPGDLLLMRVIARACANGLTRFDLGIGEARYKASLCDERIEMFDALVPVTMTGWTAARLVSLRQRLKRRIKQSPRLFALAKRIRALAA